MPLHGAHEESHARHDGEYCPADPGFVITLENKVASDVAPNFYPATIGVWRSALLSWPVMAAGRRVPLARYMSQISRSTQKLAGQLWPTFNNNCRSDRDARHRLFPEAALRGLPGTALALRPEPRARLLLWRGPAPLQDFDHQRGRPSHLPAISRLAPTSCIESGRSGHEGTA
jgi:hypothetical protein